MHTGAAFRPVELHQEQIYGFSEAEGVDSIRVLDVSPYRYANPRMHIAVSLQDTSVVRFLRYTQIATKYYEGMNIFFESWIVFLSNIYFPCEVKNVVLHWLYEYEHLFTF